MQETVPYASMPAAPSYAVDDSNVRVLSILHFVWGGLLLLGGLFAVIYIVMGVIFLNNPGMMTPPAPAPASPSPSEFAYIFIGIGCAGFFSGMILGGLSIYSGVLLSRRQRRGIIKFTSALNCIVVPMGTLLGIFTFIVLSRPSVKASFETRP